MPTITVLPNGDGTRSNVQTIAGSTSNLNQAIDELVASPNDVDGIITTNNSASMFFDLEAMPSDFSAATSIAVKQRARRDSGSTNTVTAQLFKGDESTAITGTAVTPVVATSLTNYTTNPSITGATDKTSWDAARLKLTFNRVDTVITALQVDITYDAISGQPTQSRFSMIRFFRGLVNVGRKMWNAA